MAGITTMIEIWIYGPGFASQYRFTDTLAANKAYSEIIGALTRDEKGIQIDAMDGPVFIRCAGLTAVSYIDRGASFDHIVALRKWDREFMKRLEETDKLDDEKTGFTT